MADIAGAGEGGGAGDDGDRRRRSSRRFTSIERGKAKAKETSRRVRPRQVVAGRGRGRGGVPIGDPVAQSDSTDTDEEIMIGREDRVDLDADARQTGLPFRSRYRQYDADYLVVPTVEDDRLVGDLTNHPCVLLHSSQVYPRGSKSFRGAWPSFLTAYGRFHGFYQEFLHYVGFEHFLSIRAFRMGHGYVLALIERWFSATQSIHLPCGELVPTPYDWAMVLGIRFTGTPVPLSSETSWATVEELLGPLSPDDHCKNGKMKMASIARTVDFRLPPPDDLIVRERYCRILLLWFLCCTFLCNHNSVLPYDILEATRDLSSLPTFDWGSFTFGSFLSAMRARTGTVWAGTYGFWQFLPFWAFEYLPSMRPYTLSEDLFPRAMKWHRMELEEETTFRDFLAARVQLEILTRRDVVWHPYRTSEHNSLYQDERRLSLQRRRFRGLFYWELFMGDRARHQFHIRLQIPVDPPGPLERSGATAAIPPEELERYAVSFPGERPVGQRVSEEQYFAWWRRVSLGPQTDVTYLVGGTLIGARALEMWTHMRGQELVSVEEFRAVRAERDSYRMRSELYETEIMRLRAQLEAATIGRPGDPSPGNGGFRARGSDIASSQRRSRAFPDDVGPSQPGFQGADDPNMSSTDQTR